MLKLLGPSFTGFSPRSQRLRVADAGPEPQVIHPEPENPIQKSPRSQSTRPEA